MSIENMLCEVSGVRPHHGRCNLPEGRRCLFLPSAERRLNSQFTNFSVNYVHKLLDTSVDKVPLPGNVPFHLHEEVVNDAVHSSGHLSSFFTFVVKTSPSFLKNYRVLCENIHI